MACLKHEGTVLAERQSFKIERTQGPITSKTSLKRLEGMTLGEKRL